MTKINFSDKGWTSVISDGFTFKNVRIIAQAFCNYLRREQNYIDNFPPRIVIGFDTRFLGQKYAEEIADIVIKNGFDAHVSDRPSPSPSIMWSVKTLVFTGGIMITGGEMPYEFSGIKLITPQGDLLQDQVTKEIEAECYKMMETGLPEFPITPGELTEFNPTHYYFHQVSNMVNLSKIAKSCIDITIDSMNGSASSYIKNMLFKHDLMVRELNNKPSYNFGGLVPTLNKENLISLQQTVLDPRTNLQVGFAIDSEGTKLKVVDISGAVISDEAIACILLKHLVENKKIERPIVKPYGEGKLIEKLANKLGIKVYETKNRDSRAISEIMRLNNCSIGTSLDGDFHININHILEKDAIITSMLLLEAMSIYKHNLGYLYNKISEELVS
jgi:phosphomannomutase